MHLCCFGSLFFKSSCCVLFLIFGFVLLHIVCGCLTDIFIFPLFQYCMMDWYLQYVSTHGYVVLEIEIECSKFVDCICVVSVICFWKVHVVFCSIHKITKWFLVLFYHIRISLINFINVKISLQGGAVYISGGSGTFDSCSFEGNGDTAGVSSHGYVGLDIDCCKFVGCICVDSDLCFWKVHVMFCSIHKKHFMIFGFVLLHIVCGCLTDIFLFFLYIVWTIVFADCK